MADNQQAAEEIVERVGAAIWGESLRYRPIGWEKGVAAAIALIEAETREKAAAWHDEKAREAAAKHNPRLNITALLVARVHEECAQSIRSMGGSDHG